MATATSITDYNRIKTEIIRECNRYTEKDLSMLKHIFAQQVNSTRRLDNILNVQDLIAILEKRNVLNKQNFKCFQDLTAALNINKFNHFFREFHTVTGAPQVAERSNNSREQIYKLISTELGIEWKDFARALGISDPKIDEIEDAYRLISERIRKILLYYENNSNSTSWVPVLEALRKSRRNDVRIKIQNMISH